MILQMSSAVTTPRSVGLDPNEQRVIEEARARRLQRLAKREFWSLAAFTTAFVAAAAAMALYLPSERSPGVVATLVLIGAYAAAFRLEFEIGSGTAVPTELILVPMLFVLPDRMGAARRCRRRRSSRARWSACVEPCTWSASCCAS